MKGMIALLICCLVLQAFNVAECNFGVDGLGTGAVPAGPALSAPPAGPALPAGPAAPALPAGPAAPAIPAQPAVPAIPAQPAVPGISGQPSVPVLPSNLPQSSALGVSRRRRYLAQH